MNRRELIFNSLLAAGTIAAMRSAAARVFPPGSDALAELERADWRPVFLNAHQDETLIVLSEAIIPATETPGGKAALVNRFLDLVLSVEPDASQSDFITALTWFDTAAKERYKVSFAELSADQTEDLLNLVAFPHSHVRWGEHEAPFPGYEHFSLLKSWIVSAYYSSPIGLKEQGWDGWAARGTFAGCDHEPGGHSGN
jgi:Gluconate 2-dehydrogenase subunit 3